ncbi:hypothetical protein L6452_32677 [Arctium lappa]|uniref:Uncharacterized protein n=1 Tax=Arctium lappa TaxID=4217 RepID=A0ACB8Z663_ARCLA|nr:hypothetical protein L6452_32677 [Arctium lappa]
MAVRRLSSGLRRLVSADLALVTFEDRRLGFQHLKILGSSLPVVNYPLGVSVPRIRHSMVTAGDAFMGDGLSGSSAIQVEDAMQAHANPSGGVATLNHAYPSVVGTNGASAEGSQDVGKTRTSVFSRLSQQQDHIETRL